MKGYNSLKKVIAYGHRTIDNPYYKEGTCQAILDTIKTYPLENIIQKHFYDL